MIKTDLHLDPENEAVILQSIDETDARIDDLPAAVIKLEDMQYVGTADAEMTLARLRRIHWTKPTGEKRRAVVLMSKEEDDTTDDGHSDATQDIYVGGGGLTMMQVVSYHQDATHGDYLVCQPPGSGPPPTVNVAVEPQLQSAIVAQTNPDGVTWHYSTYSASGQSRLRTDDSVTEYISPAFISTDVVPVWSCSNTGVTVSSVAVTLIAITGRQWAEAAS